MPVTHIKDIPSVKMRTWSTLTDEELEVISGVINNHPGSCTVEKEEIDIGKLAGQNSPYGTVIHFSIYSGEREMPDGLLKKIEDAVIEADIATRFDKITVPRDPSGDAFHLANDHELPYKAGIRIHGKWNTIKEVEH